MNPKRLLFFLLMPFVVPLALFMNATYGWWTKLTNRRVLFFLLLPIYAPLALLMNAIFEPWTKLSE